MSKDYSKQSILIVYFMAEAEFLARPGFLSNVYLFSNVALGLDVEYLNIAAGSHQRLLKKTYCSIVFHYSVFAERMNGDAAFLQRLKLCDSLFEVEGRRIAIVQDEYVRMNLVCEALVALRTEVLCTCVPETEFRKAYPIELLGPIEPVFTIAGYMSEAMLSANSLRPHRDRPIDISYRARRLPDWLGETSVAKFLVADAVTAFLAENVTGMTADISTNPRDMLYGNSWRSMLVKSRTVLGSESGVSVLDFDGSIHDYSKNHDRLNTLEYAKMHGKKFHLSGISPRHFEAASTKTCQLLVEGGYSGILNSRRHYIPINPSFSNLESVLKDAEDIEKCERIAEVAYKEITQNERYSEKYFVKTLLEPSNAHERSQVTSDRVRVILLGLHNLTAPLKHLVINAKLLVVRVMNQIKIP